jgi:NTE family protein
MTTAFVLSGGASLGAIQAGMLEALYEHEIRPDLIVGTSAGALNGAFIADREHVPETARELADVWRGLSRGKVFPANPLSGALGFLGVRSHLVPDSGLRRLVREHLVSERLEDTAVPLHVIATDILTGHEIRLSEGPLEDAVLASAAIPGVLPPVDWDGRQLVDGGVSNNAPIRHALELGADRVYVLATAGPCELEEPPRGALAMLVHATGLLVRQGLAHDLATLPHRDRVVVLPPPCPITVQPSDFSRADHLIEEGYAEAMRFLASAPREEVPAATDVTEWRQERLTRAGFDPTLAAELATTKIDLHELLSLLDRGCPPDLAARIVEN